MAYIGIVYTVMALECIFGYVLIYIVMACKGMANIVLALECILGYLLI